MDDETRPLTYIWREGMDPIVWFDELMLAIAVGAYTATPSDEERIHQGPPWMWEDYGAEVLDRLTAHGRMLAARRGVWRDPRTGRWIRGPAAPASPAGD